MLSIVVERAIPHYIVLRKYAASNGIESFSLCFVKDELTKIVHDEALDRIIN